MFAVLQSSIVFRFRERYTWDVCNVLEARGDAQDEKLVLYLVSDL
jgi:hypothetical protein